MTKEDLPKTWEEQYEEENFFENPKRKLQDNGQPCLNLPKRDVQLLGWERGDQIIIDTNIKERIMILRKRPEQ